MKIILITLLLISCGKQTHIVEVKDSEQVIKIDWNLEQLQDLYRNDCEENFETEEEIEQCITDKVTEFIDFINQGEQND